MSCNGATTASSRATARPARQNSRSMCPPTFPIRWRPAGRRKSRDQRYSRLPGAPTGGTHLTGSKTPDRKSQTGDYHEPDVGRCARDDTEFRHFHAGGHLVRSALARNPTKRHSARRACLGAGVPRYRLADLLRPEIWIPGIYPYQGHHRLRRRSGHNSCAYFPRCAAQAAAFFVWILVLETVADLLYGTIAGLNEQIFEKAFGVTWIILAFYVPILWVSLVLTVWQLYSRPSEKPSLAFAQSR